MENPEGDAEAAENAGAQTAARFQAPADRGKALQLDPHERVSARRAAKENVFRASMLKGPLLSAACSSYRVVYPNRKLQRNNNIEIGHDMAKRLRNYFSADQLAAIDALRGSRAMTYLHIKGMPLNQDIRFPGQAGEFGTKSFEEQFHVTDMIAAGLLFLLGSECKSRWPVAGPAVVRTMISAPADAQVGDRDGLDMALRFHQSTVERKLVGIAGPEACSFKVYACLRNRRRIPVYLLRVKDIMAALPPGERDWTIKQLQRTTFERRGPKYDLVDTGEIQREQPVITRSTPEDPEDWLMSFDPERVRTDDDEAKRALRTLRNAMFAARRSARRIVPEEGDLLVVDNLRVMVSRREYDPKGFWEFATAMMFRKRTRMLRLYYGFPAPDA
ncbi:MAG: hypothetical protein KDE05_03750 [Parvularculaceae bacterium]|nr:hypothetical protein [Parvularculaceae bacterium]